MVSFGTVMSLLRLALVVGLPVLRSNIAEVVVKLVAVTRDQDGSKKMGWRKSFGATKFRRGGRLC